MNVERKTVNAENLELQVLLRGSGPLLLFFPGGIGLSTGYAPLIRLLASRYTLGVYDRRGHGRSAVPDGDQLTIEQHGRDAATVVRQLGLGPALVLGSSAGATIGLELLAHHPDSVTRLVAHEPPLVTVLEDAARWQIWYDDIVRINSRVETRAAVDYFFAYLVSDGQGEQRPVTVLESQTPEWDTYLTHEIPRIVRYQPDLEALHASGHKLNAVFGADSAGRWHARTATSLADRLGIKALEIPGGHLAPVYQPTAFADAVGTLLR